MQTLVEQVWTKEWRRFYNRYSSLWRSSRIDELRALVDRGEIDKAHELAREIEARHPHIRVENTVARRLRIERVALFARLNDAEEELRAIFTEVGKGLSDKVGRKADSLGNLRYLYGAVHDTAIELRRRLRTWMNGTVKDAARMGLKNAGDAFLPIFKDNQEAALWEERLSIGLSARLANRFDPRVKLTSGKWRDKLTKIFHRQAKSNVSGQSYSERVWELTRRAEADMKRLLANEIADGTSTERIARKIKKYLSPDITAKDGLAALSPGVYASPFKNAWRLARTEAGRAYTASSAEWAKDKKWITGIQSVVTSDNPCPECERIAGMGTLTPDEFNDLIPAHPHCMCGPKYVIDPKFYEELDAD